MNRIELLAAALAYLLAPASATCYNMTWSDVADASDRTVYVSSAFCYPFNDPVELLSGGGGSQFAASEREGWTVYLDPCNRVDQSPHVCATGNCVANVKSAAANPDCTAGRYEYSSAPIRLTLSHYVLKSTSAATRALFKVSMDDVDLDQDEIEVPRCNPLWIAGVNVSLFDLDIDLANCALVSVLGVADRVCIRFVAEDASHSHVRGCTCQNAGNGIIVQPPAGGFAKRERKGNTVVVTNTTFELAGWSVESGVVEHDLIKFWNAYQPDPALPLVVESVQIAFYSPELWASHVTIVTPTGQTGKYDNASLYGARMQTPAGTLDAGRNTVHHRVWIGVGIGLVVVVLLAIALCLCHACIKTSGTLDADDTRRMREYAREGKKRR